MVKIKLRNQMYQIIPNLLCMTYVWNSCALYGMKVTVKSGASFIFSRSQDWWGFQKTFHDGGLEHAQRPTWIWCHSLAKANPMFHDPPAPFWCIKLLNMNAAGSKNCTAIESTTTHLSISKIWRICLTQKATCPWCLTSTKSYWELDTPTAMVMSIDNWHIAELCIACRDEYKDVEWFGGFSMIFTMYMVWGT